MQTGSQTSRRSFEACPRIYSCTFNKIFGWNDFAWALVRDSDFKYFREYCKTGTNRSEVLEHYDLDPVLWTSSIVFLIACVTQSDRVVTQQSAVPDV